MKVANEILSNLKAADRKREIKRKRKKTQIDNTQNEEEKRLDGYEDLYTPPALRTPRVKKAKQVPSDETISLNVNKKQSIDETPEPLDCEEDIASNFITVPDQREVL